MKDLRFPKNEDEKYIAASYNELNQFGNKYIVEINCIDGQLHTKDQRKESISLYHYYLKEVCNDFPGMMNLQRHLQKEIGYRYKDLGKHSKKQGNLESSVDAYQKAMFWFQFADETINYYTDLVGYQSYCATNAIDIRNKLGLDKEITQWLVNRVFGLNIIRYSSNCPFPINKFLPDSIENILEEITNDIVRGYLIRYPYPALSVDEDEEVKKDEDTLESLPSTTSLELQTTDEINVN